MRSKRIEVLLEHQKSPKPLEATSATESSQRPKGSPAATWIRFLQHVGLQGRELGEKMHQKSPSRPEATSATESSQRPKGSPAATWIRFLQHVGLQDLKLGDDDLETTAADYLPDDVLAVPAYADLGFIVAVTAAIGAHSFRTNSQSRYPVIIGDGFQFDFRQHPTLGNIGAFSRYGQGNRSTESLSTNLIIRAIRHSRGDIDIGPLFLKSPLDYATAQEDTPKHSFNAFIPAKSAECLQTLTLHKCKRRNTLCQYELKYRGTDEHHLLWLFVAKVPENIPAIFPSKWWTVSNILPMLALNSSFWSSRRDTLLSKSTPALIPGEKGMYYLGSSPPEDPMFEDLKGPLEIPSPKHAAE
jgi:hypothetical protein